MDFGALKRFRLSRARPSSIQARRLLDCEGSSAMTDTAIHNVVSNLDAVKDVITVQRVFGEPTHVDGVTVLPVAVVRGGGGPGGGGGVRPDAEEQGGRRGAALVDTARR